MVKMLDLIKSTPILLEATLTPDIIKKMIESGNRVSVYYKGDDLTKKGWKQISALRTESKDGVDYLVARDWGSADEKEIKLIVSLITNWNVLSKVSKDLDTLIKDSITNKRVVTIRYRGAEETSVGTRIKVKPVCFGYRANKRKYIRAWQEGGKTVTEVPAWKFFRMDRISGWEVDGTETFSAAPGPNFNTEGDKMMDGIYAIADFSPDDAGDPTPPTLPKKPKSPSSKAKETPPKPSSSTKPTSVPKKEEPPKKPLKGPARPGASDKDKLKESNIISAILEAVRIL